MDHSPRRPIPMSIAHPLRRLATALTVAFVAPAALASSASAKPPSVVASWNTFASNLVAATLVPGPQTYTLAVTQIAVHDALNSIDHRYEPYAYAGSAPT